MDTRVNPGHLLRDRITIDRSHVSNRALDDLKQSFCRSVSGRTGSCDVDSSSFERAIVSVKVVDESSSLNRNSVPRESTCGAPDQGREHGKLMRDIVVLKVRH